MNAVTCKLTGPLNRTAIQHEHEERWEILEGSALTLAWSNVDFSKIENAEEWGEGTFPDPQEIPGSNPIDLTLQFLLSTGAGTNGDYDVFEPGVGLGIPESLVDVASFASLKDPAIEFDYDVDQRVFFIFTAPEPAKRFIETELCRPFGFYLATGNDGKIRCVRPRHPQKFYIGGSNNRLTPSNRRIPIGVYTGPELAAEVSKALENLEGVFGSQACTYDEPNHWFEVVATSPGYAITPADEDSIWPTLGWTTPTTLSGTVSGAVRGALPQAIVDRTLTQDDMWGVRILDNRGDRIVSVTYQYDYDVATGNYLSFRRYADLEAMQLLGPISSPDYTIRSRGLISGGVFGNSWVAPVKSPVFGCKGKRAIIDRRWSVDANTWTRLHALSLIDRYKEPPLKFRARLKWRWNTLEIGDVVRVHYTIPGIFMDFERNKDWLDNRLFEVVELSPNPDGSIDATFLGHRYVSY